MSRMTTYVDDDLSDGGPLTLQDLSTIDHEGMDLAECEHQLQNSIRLLMAANQQLHLVWGKVQGLRVRLHRAVDSRHHGARYKTLLKLHTLEGVTSMYRQYCRKKSSQIQHLVTLKAELMEKALQRQLDFMDFVKD